MEKSHATGNEKITRVTSSPLIISNVTETCMAQDGTRETKKGWGYGGSESASEVTGAGQGHWWGPAPARTVIGRERWRGSQ